MSYRGGMLLGAVLASGIWLAGDAVQAQDPPKKPDPKEEARKLAEEAKKRDEEIRKKAEEQKQTAKLNWDSLEIGEPVFKETSHLLVYAPKGYKNIQPTSGYLENVYNVAARALAMKPKDSPWPGKLTVYLFTERDQFAAFRRRVEKQRLEPEDTSSFEPGDTPHVSGSPPQSAGDLTAEGQAGEQLAMALLMKDAAEAPLPIWLTRGFGRATFYLATPSSRITAAEHQRAYAVLKDKKYGAPQVFNNGVPAEDSLLMRASLAEFLAYGAGSAKFSALLAGFKPDKEKKEQMRNTDQALKSAGIEAETITKAWHRTFGIK